MSAPRPRAAWITTTVATTLAGGLLATGAASAVVGIPGTSGQHAYTARVNVGEGDTARGCSGVLVGADWVLSAASCFADKPGDVLPAGKPKLKATATLGTTVLEVTELVPRTDRDAVLAKLAKPVTGIVPAKVASAAPAQGANLMLAGFGRTKTEWVPGKLHTGAFTLASTGAASYALNSKGGTTDTVCQGDAGGPVLNGQGEITALASRSWQGGCLGTAATETRTNAIAARVDDLRDWIDTNRARASGWKTQAFVQAGSSVYQAVRLPDGSWTGFSDLQAKVASLGGVRSSAVAGVNGDTHVLAISNSAGLYHTVRRENGSWDGFGDVFSAAGTLGKLTQVSAVSIGYELHVVAVADGKALHTVRNAAGEWTPFRDVTSGSVANVTAAATASVRGELQVGIVSGGKAYHSIRQTNGNWLGWGNVAQAAGATGPITSIGMAGSGDETHFVIAADAGTRQYHTIRNFNGTWSAFGELKDVLGTVTAKSVSAATVNGEIQVTATTADGKLLHTTRHANRTWDAPVTVPLLGLPAAPGSLATTATYTG
ncbi:hypothetical protein GCM10010371_67990 [Streptomyces subrutilus]|nr:S1 family peptidase [Streptomyces subrutilus]GGZ98788.1 hypothetical protein GCM10010371_67990 [Streptomyces subrutilus]